MTEPNRSVTDRGFDTYDEFTDSYGAQVTVRQSSSATEDAVWVFAEWPARDQHLPPGAALALEAAGFGDLDYLAACLSPSPHLNVEQATRLRDALDTFIREHRDG